MLLASGCLVVRMSMISGSFPIVVANWGLSSGGGEDAARGVRFACEGLGLLLSIPRIWLNSSLTSLLFASRSSAVGLGGKDFSAFLGGAIWILLRSRRPSLDIRADCSEEYDSEIAPMYARTSPLSNLPLGPVAVILLCSEIGMPFSRSN